MSASPSKGNVIKSFASRGGVKEHDNLDGPACPKCGQVCKNKEGLRNHLLSHYYELFFEVHIMVQNLDILTFPKYSVAAWSFSLHLPRV